MSAEPIRHTMTRQEYLTMEEQSAERHEYVRGQVYPRHGDLYVHTAMAGARRHVRLVTRLGGLLDAHLGVGPCEVYTTDMRLRVDAADADFYPDLFVACGGDAHANPIELYDARLVIETLSLGTEGYDLTDKFEAYKLLPSLEEYVLIATRRIAATIYRRMRDDRWLVQTLGPDDMLELTSIDYRVGLATLYAGIEFGSANET